MRSSKGFTLMELTVVLAILAIIAVILIPMFLNTTDRARLRSDIQSARVIQNAMELYSVERGEAVTGNIAAVLNTLQNAELLNAQATDIQTEGAQWYIDTQRRVVVNIAGSPDGVHRAYAGLPAVEQAFVVGGIAN